LRDAQVEVRRIRTRIAGLSLERGVIERSSFRVWSIRTRSAGSKFAEGELLRDAQLGVPRIKTRCTGSELEEWELLRDAQLGVR
jgi:hypothetical protein